MARRDRYEDDDYEDDEPQRTAKKPMIANVSGPALYATGVVLVVIFWLLLGIIDRPSNIPDFMAFLNMRQNGVIVGCAMIVSGSILYSSGKRRS